MRIAPEFTPRQAPLISREFLADRSYPEHNSVAMHLLGFPQRWAKRPFVAQAKRLFQRYRVLRGLIRQDEPGWQLPFADAILQFERTGELPQGGVVRDVALAECRVVGVDPALQRPGRA